MRLPATAAAVLACCLFLAPGASARLRPLDGSHGSGGGKPLAPADVLRKAELAFRAPSNGSKRDVSPLLKELAAALPRLSGADRRRATALLERPTDGPGDPAGNGWRVAEAAGSPLCSAHFCVHWVDSGTDAPPLTDSNGNGKPDWVETVDSVAETAYSTENGTLGWRAPKSDGTLGGDGRTDIYLADVGGNGIYGYTAPDPGQSMTRTDHSQFAYLVLDNDFAKGQFPSYDTPVAPLQVTLAHEYNHVLQYTYDSLEDTWMFESTAVWMEGKVFEPVHDYLQYLPGWVQLTTQPITAFNGQNPNDRTNVKVYGSAVWNKWLDARFGADAVRRAWEDSVGALPQSFAPAAYDLAIRRHNGLGFADQFDRFAAATAEWQAQNSGFPEGPGFPGVAAYPDVQRVGSLPIDGSPGTLTLDHTAYALVDVPPLNVPRAKLAVTAPRGTAAAIALVGRVGGVPGGTATVAIRELPKGGGGTVLIPNPGSFARLTAVLVNSDVSQRGYSTSKRDWIFTRDRQKFIASMSTDFTRPRVTSRTPRPGSRVRGRPRITVGFSERALGVTKKSFELIAANGRAVSVRLTFADGSRKASLVPTRALRSGVRYRVKLTSAITDLALNPLRRAPSWSFTAR